jgi:hypothetical protein
MGEGYLDKELIPSTYFSRPKRRGHAVNPMPGEHRGVGSSIATSRRRRPLRLDAATSPLAVLALLAIMHEPALQEEDADGQLPLHCAARYDEQVLLESRDRPPKSSCTFAQTLTWLCWIFRGGTEGDDIRFSLAFSELGNRHFRLQNSVQCVANRGPHPRVTRTRKWNHQRGRSPKWGKPTKTAWEHPSLPPIPNPRTVQTANPPPRPSCLGHLHPFSFLLLCCYFAQR